ncbi:MULTISPECIES: alpha/beta fold hydrolase [unclassified Beijerinckia]|uniref:alpha/beta hydrolase family protein n=1 Tax=unclassified Beijerinckia TaxID=2638183 RepID=UPI00089B0D81|nr:MULTISPECIES: alpha/beta fold hydrolase [unclassified Beijerinckia]MDH7799258.1 2,6-dihydroxypseudooxynicotine hydrolase [Beijerinckia sp. GAS462]SED90494.1 2,6-dihydroxypseudooxynicotine hydrolase [Beijerinckia sp. 28-YEA-48]
MDIAVANAIDANAMRIVSDGIPCRDLDFLKRDITNLQDWCARWIVLSEEYEAQAYDALDKGGNLTAGERFWRAALCCHFGQGILMEIGAEEKLQADQRKQQLFARGASLLQPQCESVAIPFENSLLPGYLRLPIGLGPFPCMILFGGLDTTKEDAFELSSYFLARNIATLTFDGPGQGEVFHRMKMRLDYEKAVSATVTFAGAQTAIDPNRIGVLGRSTGGHWACKAAATDPRIKVAIAWGLIYHLRDFDQLSTSLQQRFMRAASMTSLIEARAFFKGFDLDGFAERIDVPLLVVQGGQDPIAPRDSITRLGERAQSSMDVIFYEHSGHCAHDRAHLFKPAMADFAKSHL